MIDIQANAIGDWAISHFEVSKNDSRMTMFHAAANNNGWHFVPPGKYTRLTHNGHVIMSDTPNEMSEHREVLIHAHGHVLVGGLGLGLVVKDLMQFDKVDKVTVIELEEDVIKLTAPHLTKYGNRLEIIHGDIYTLPLQGRQWHTAWFDIWPTIDTDNLPEMRKLSYRYRKPVIGWKGYWSRERCRSMKRRESSTRWGW